MLAAYRVQRTRQLGSSECAPARKEREREGEAEGEGRTPERSPRLLEPRTDGLDARAQLRHLVALEHAAQLADGELAQERAPGDAPAKGEEGRDLARVERCACTRWRRRRQRFVYNPDLFSTTLWSSGRGRARARERRRTVEHLHVLKDVAARLCALDQARVLLVARAEALVEEDDARRDERGAQERLGLEERDELGGRLAPKVLERRLELGEGGAAGVRESASRARGRRREVGWGEGRGGGRGGSSEVRSVRWARACEREKGDEPTHEARILGKSLGPSALLSGVALASAVVPVHNTVPASVLLTSTERESTRDVEDERNARWTNVQTRFMRTVTLRLIWTRRTRCGGLSEKKDGLWRYSASRAVGSSCVQQSPSAMAPERVLESARSRGERE